jgi:hypothetical protein
LLGLTTALSGLSPKKAQCLIPAELNPTADLAGSRSYMEQRLYFLDSKSAGKFPGVDSKRYVIGCEAQYPCSYSCVCGAFIRERAPHNVRDTKVL